jgi:hypothetical protein
MFPLEKLREDKRKLAENEMETMDHGQEKEVEMRYKPSTRPVAV